MASAPRVPAAGAHPADSFNGKVEVDLVCRDATIAAQVSDAATRLWRRLPARPEKSRVAQETIKFGEFKPFGAPWIIAGDSGGKFSGYWRAETQAGHDVAISLKPECSHPSTKEYRNNLDKKRKKALAPGLAACSEGDILSVITR